MVLRLAAEVTLVVLRPAGAMVQVQVLRVALGDPVDLVVEVADAAQALEVGTKAAEPWFGPNGVPRASRALPAVATAKAE